jgi:RHS repeat-associated protein
LQRLEAPWPPDALYKFTAKEQDSETGYDYFGARYFDARVGRWLAMDPFAEKYPSTSPMAYCANNPMRLVDVNGRFYIGHDRYGWYVSRFNVPEVQIHTMIEGIPWAGLLSLSWRAVHGDPSFRPGMTDIGFALGNVFAIRAFAKMALLDPNSVYLIRYCSQFVTGTMKMAELFAQLIDQETRRKLEADEQLFSKALSTTVLSPYDNRTYDFLVKEGWLRTQATGESQGSSVSTAYYVNNAVIDMWLRMGIKPEEIPGKIEELLRNSTPESK